AECRENVAEFCDAFPVLSKLASCRRLAAWLLYQGFPPEHTAPLHELLQWLEGGLWLATFSEKNKVRAREFGERLAAARPGLRGVLRAGLELLLLWLNSTGEPGLPKPRLRELDRAWWWCQDAAPGWPMPVRRLANAPVAAAYRQDWPRAARQASSMLGLLRR